MSAQADQAQVKSAPKCDQCEKPFSSNQSLARHVKTIHDGIVGLKNLFSTPKSLANKKRLFTSVPNLSTQGNSAGQVNDLKVVSEGTFICGACDEEFPNEDEMANHISNDHDNATAANESVASESGADTQDTGDNDENNMFNSDDDKDLNEAFDEIFRELDSRENAPESAMMQQKIERFKVLIKKKTMIQKESNIEVANSKQVEAHQYNEIKKKEKEINNLKKAAAKDKEKYIKDIESLRKSNSNTIKENADLNAKLKEKESLIKSLEEALEPDNSEEVVVMNRNTSGHKCTACNKKYSSNNDLENHMNDMHGEVECVFCSQIFPNKKKLRAHVNNCIENGTAMVKCNMCDQLYTRFGIERHRNQCHKNVRTFNCNECGLICNTENEIKKHKKNDHEEFQEVSKEVCYHYRQGNCFRGDRCKFSHVGGTNSSSTKQSITRIWTPACTKGDGCSWLAQGDCRYFHRGIGVQRPMRQSEAETRSAQGRQSRPNQTSSRGAGGRGPCLYGDECFRKETCGFSHGRKYEQGFPPLTRRNQLKRRNGGRN